METKKRIKNQEEVYSALVKYRKDRIEIPSIMELAKMVKRPKTTVWRVLHQLEEKGRIKIIKGKKKGIVLEEEFDDEYIYFCEDDIEEEEYEQYGFGKSNKRS